MWSFRTWCKDQMFDISQTGSIIPSLQLIGWFLGAYRVTELSTDSPELLTIKTKTARKRKGHGRKSVSRAQYESRKQIKQTRLLVEWNCSRKKKFGVNCHWNLICLPFFSFCAFWLASFVTKIEVWNYLLMAARDSQWYLNWKIVCTSHSTLAEEEMQQLNPSYPENNPGMEKVWKAYTATQSLKICALW